MLIENLEKHPHVIPTLSEWHYAQWGYLHPGDSPANRASWFQKHLAGLSMPATFLALLEYTLLGSASLIEYDMDERKDLAPWLASVYVAPEHRRRGVASALVNRVVEEAGRLGVDTLYLYTPDQESLYARLGWTPFERTEHRGQRIVIMTIEPKRVRPE
jgi:GNAT superfamily N-acetyltransferase